MMWSQDHADGSRWAGDLTRREFVISTILAAQGYEVLYGRSKSDLQSTDDINCIFILLVGGPSQIDTWDMKPLAVQEVRGPFSPIATRVPGIWISELFPQLAGIMDKVSLVRTLCHQTAAIHDRGHQALQTGREFDDALQHPHFGSVLAWLKGSRNGVPPYHLLPGPVGMTGGNMSHGQHAGYLGDAYSPVDFHEREVSTQRATPSSISLAGTDRLLKGAAPRICAKLQREPGVTNRRYGDSAFGRNCLRARQLIES
jgi:hypothetical protein